MIIIKLISALNAHTQALNDYVAIMRDDAKPKKEPSKKVTRQRYYTTTGERLLNITWLNLHYIGVPRADKIRALMDAQHLYYEWHKENCFATQRDMEKIAKSLHLKQK